MTVKEALYARRSTRAFLSKSVEEEKLRAVLEAAVRTPSWANSQPWEVFVATGDTLERIKKGYSEKYAQKAEAAPETPDPRRGLKPQKGARSSSVPICCGTAAAL